MGWPTPQEYNEAIQNPQTAFADPELKASRPVVTSMGLPRPISGGFASVYQLMSQEPRTYAVRCFLRDFGDHQERYAAISAHLASTNLPYTVDFTFLAQGIRVSQRWFPILKMEWVSGEALHTYVERNLRNSAALLALAEQWIEMIRTLRRASIGHGDLQHGNVMVVDGQLRLIDYDGMFVPGLAGWSSHEIGHRNFQHPGRTEEDFGPHVDHFSTWVVYTSLVALAVDPTWWHRFEGGDECLLFRREDFLKPERSPVLQTLIAAPDPRLQNLARAFGALLCLPIDQVPPVDREIPEREALMRSPVTPLSGWLEDHVRRATSGSVTTMKPDGGNRPRSTYDEPAWIEDFIGPHLGQKVGFQGSASRQRLVVLGSLATVLLLGAGLSAGGIGLIVPVLLMVLTLAVDIGYLAAAYARDPSVLAQRASRVDLRRLERRMRRLGRVQLEVDRDLSTIQRVYDQQRARLARTELHLREDMRRASDREAQKLEHRLAALAERRSRLQRQEADEVQQARAKLTAAQDRLRKEVGMLRQTEAEDLRRALAKRQQQFVDDFIKRQRVDTALITGIGPVVKQRLREHGIVWGSDIEASRLARVPGIGEGRMAALLDWRLQLENLARQAGPQNLSKIEETLRRGKFLHRRLRIEKEGIKVKQQSAARVDDIRRKYVDRYQQLVADEQRLQEQHKRAMEQIHRRQVSREAKLQQERTTLEAQAGFHRSEAQGRADQLEHSKRQLQWQRATIERQLERYAGLEFGNYVKQVMMIFPTQ